MYIIDSNPYHITIHVNIFFLPIIFAKRNNRNISPVPIVPLSGKLCFLRRVPQQLQEAHHFFTITLERDQMTDSALSLSA
jgi:hypothetical protein